MPLPLRLDGPPAGSRPGERLRPAPGRRFKLRSLRLASGRPSLRHGLLTGKPAACFGHTALGRLRGQPATSGGPSLGPGSESSPPAGAGRTGLRAPARALNFEVPSSPPGFRTLAAAARYASPMASEATSQTRRLLKLRVTLLKQKNRLSNFERPPKTFRLGGTSRLH
jgi:hypothetical protein